MRIRFRSAVLAAMLSVNLPLAHAAGPGGCDAFDWPLTIELAWMTAADPVAVASGAEIPLPPEKALALALVPQQDAKLAAPASGKPKAMPETPLAGTVTIASPGAAGIYQVTLSSPGWIDVVQNGKALTAVGHTGKADCPAIRKSVRFDLQAAPTTLQVTSAGQTPVRLTLRKID